MSRHCLVGCILGLFGLFACGGTPRAATSCAIEGTLYAVSQPNPANNCQVCAPEQTANAWSNLPSGTPCGSGALCSGGSCQASCLVGGVSFPVGATSPDNVCLTCQPAVSTTAFSRFTGVPVGHCGVGLYCDRGVCSSGCTIASGSQPPGAINPDNPCQNCQPGVSLTGWSDLPIGTSCGGGGAVCAGGVCLFGCEISGILYAPGVVDPADPCRTCQPAVSVTAFSPFTGVPATACTGGQVCNAGTCVVGCFIQGTLVPSRDYRPNDTSFCCSPATDPSTWTQSFIRSATYATGAADSYRLHSIATGDFNGDGLPDVAVLNGVDATVSLYLNQGAGHFAAQAVYPTGPNPGALAVGDLNGDRCDDIVVVDTLITSTNNGAIGVLFSLPCDAGGFDCGLSTESQIAFSNDGASSYYSNCVVLKDVDNDKTVDVVAGSAYTNSFSVFLNLGGDGGLAPEAVYSEGSLSASEIAVADYNGDGFLDIAMAGRGSYPGTSTASVFINDRSGKFPTMASYPVNRAAAIATADFNRDGVPDLAGTGLSATETLLGIGDGGFLPEVSNALAYGTNIAASDINGDGLADLVVSDYSGDLIFYIGQGDGTFRTTSRIPMQMGASFVIRDLNGDGAPDIAVLDSFGGTWTLWLNSCP